MLHLQLQSAQIQIHAPAVCGYDRPCRCEVVAEIELAWTKKKIAYLTEDQSEYEEILTEKGWTIIHNDTAVSKEIFGGED